MPSKYKTATYAAAALWQADTKVKYNANPKSGKSFDRYAKYEKARTIEESLSLGSKPEDLLFDYEKGHLNILGPLRETPLNPFKLKPADFSKLRDADLLLIRYGCRHDPKAKKGGSEHIKDLEANLKDYRKRVHCARCLPQSLFMCAPLPRIHALRRHLSGELFDIEQIACLPWHAP